MIVLGVFLLIIGYWFLPAFVPTVPPQLDSLAIFLGWLFLVVGLLLFFFGMVTGRPVGGRRYWW